MSDGFLKKIADQMLPFRIIRCLMDHRYLLADMTKKNILAQFRHSVLGVLWLFLPPGCILLLYVYLFNVIFKLKWPENEVTTPWGFGLVVFSGITAYAIFSESVMGCIHTIPAHSNYVRKVPFPLELLPAAQVLAKFLVNGLILTGIFAVTTVFMKGAGWTGIFFLPLVLFPLLLISLGAGWFMAALGVIFRDIGNLTGIVVTIMFFTAPVFYSAQMVPGKFRWIMWLNPLSSIICNIRSVALFAQVPDWRLLVFSWVFSYLVLQFGFGFFRCLRRRFADVL